MYAILKESLCSQWDIYTHFEARRCKITAKIVRIIAKTLSYLLISAVVILAILLGGVRLFGLTPYTVLSGSMEPAYHVGSVIYVTDADPADLEVGDAATYSMSTGTLVTHRIVEITDEEGELTFVLKGDANKNSEGEIVPASAVVGKPLFTIPYLGYVSEFVTHPTGLIMLAVICIAVFILSYTADNLLKEKDEKEEKKEEKH